MVVNNRTATLQRYDPIKMKVLIGYWRLLENDWILISRPSRFIDVKGSSELSWRMAAPQICTKWAAQQTTCNNNNKVRFDCLAQLGVISTQILIAMRT